MITRFYSKKKQGRWITICIDLCLVAYGKTREQSMCKCFEMASTYVKYVDEMYPKVVNKYIPRMADKEFIEEYQKEEKNI